MGIAITLTNMIKKNTFVTVEYTNSNGEWGWYGTYKVKADADPVRAALDHYAEEHDINRNDFIHKEDGWYTGDEEARAFAVAIETI